MAESVAGGCFVYAGGAHGGFDGILQVFLAHMMPLLEASARMAFPVKKDETPNPVGVGLLGSNAEVFSPDGVSNLLEKFRLVR